MARQETSRQEMEALMTELHEVFGRGETTPQQEQLMRNLQQHIHNEGEPEVDRLDLVDSLEVMVEDLEADHPRSAGILREIVAILRNMGV